MLEETLHEKQIENDTSCSCKDESTINNLTSKLTSAILGNDEFHKAIQNIVITNLNSMLSEQLTEIEKVKEKQESLPQYSRRNCLVFHGILKENEESTNEVIQNFCKEKLDFELDSSDIDRSHRLLKSHLNTKPKPIILKLVRLDVKQLIYGLKKRLKDSDTLNTESLTQERLQCVKKFAQQRKTKKTASYWTSDGKMFYIKSGSTNVTQITGVLNFGNTCML